MTLEDDPPRLHSKALFLIHLSLTKRTQKRRRKSFLPRNSLQVQRYSSETFLSKLRKMKFGNFWTHTNHRTTSKVQATKKRTGLGRFEWVHLRILVYVKGIWEKSFSSRLCLTIC